MKLLPSLLRPLTAVLLLAYASTPLLAQQAGPDPRTAPTMPDPKLTPGDTLPVTLADIQVKGYSEKVRNVPISVKREVYASYGIAQWKPREYEVDHLISLSLGGSNSKRNLWPQSFLTEPWNAHVKDQLEDKLLALVRAGKVDLHTAQQEMATDWIAAYKKYVSPKPLATKKSPAGTYEPDTETGTGTKNPPPADASDGTGQVWVNTKSGVIWKPGSQYYGKTKEGRYMSEQEALAAGYHVAK